MTNIYWYIEQRNPNGKVHRWPLTQDEQAMRNEMMEFQRIKDAGLRAGCLAQDFPAVRLMRIDLAFAELVEIQPSGRTNVAAPSPSPSYQTPTAGTPPQTRRLW